MKKYQFTIFALLAMFVAVSTTYARPNRQQGQVPSFILKKFDTNKDSKMSKAEWLEFRKSRNNGNRQQPTTLNTKTNSADLLTPNYYKSGNQQFKNEINTFLKFANREQLHHPLKNSNGKMLTATTPAMGQWGVGKGPGRKSSHHPAIDFHVGGRTKVNVYAAHDGIIHTAKNVKKLRQYVSVIKKIKNSQGKIVGKLVTVYAHVDLDLDEKSGLRLNGKKIKKGGLISKHFYAKTKGGPHLHFEIRYYRPNNIGNEIFYNFNKTSKFTTPSAGPWSYGYWNPNIGYGYGNPKTHGIK